jgi:hypothetical protein
MGLKENWGLARPDAAPVPNSFSGSKWALVLIGVIAALGLASQAMACPYCKVSAANLAQDDTEGTLADLKEPVKWALTGGLDYATAYMHRGYLHQDSGLIVQPFVTVACAWEAAHELTLTPYATFWNSIDLDSKDVSGPLGGLPCAILHHHAGGALTSLGKFYNLASWANGNLTGTGADWYQTEWMVGAVLRWRDLWIDLKYDFYAYPTGIFLPIQEIGGKMSYDVASCWRETKPDSQFFLRPYVSLFQETVNYYDDNATYFEVGVEPSFRCELWGQRIGITLPVALGMSLDNYYVDVATGQNEFIGYWSAGAVASMALPTGSKLGNWYLTGSVIYYHLVANSLKAIDGTSDEVVGKIGVSFAF